MSYVLFTILAMPWRPLLPLDASHIKTKFSSCCWNTSALVAYLQVTIWEAVPKGKCVRDIDPADEASRGLTANKFVVNYPWKALRGVDNKIFTIYKYISLRESLTLAKKVEIISFWDNVKPRDHNRTERGSKGVGRDILISQKLCFRTMRTTRKQFPVNWLTSGRLNFTILRPKARRSQQMKKWRPKSRGMVWRDFELINCPSSTKNGPTIETG